MLGICLSVYMYVCLSVWLSVCLCVCLSVYLYICVSVYRSVGALSMCFAGCACLITMLTMRACTCVCIYYYKHYFYVVRRSHRNAKRRRIQRCLHANLYGCVYVYVSMFCLYACVVCGRQSIIHFLLMEVSGYILKSHYRAAVPNLWPAGQKWPAKPRKVAPALPKNG